MIRRFVNILAENCNGGTTLHRLDVAKHLFYPSRDRLAQVMPLVAEAQAGTAAAGDKPQLEVKLELPAPCMSFQSFPMGLLPYSKLAFTGLLSPFSGEDKVICMTRAGDALLYNADSNTTRIMPSLNDQLGPRPISVSIARPGAHDQEEEDLYLMHKSPKPHDTSSCFRVLRFSISGESEVGSYRWESLPPPPFVNNPLYRTSRIRSHTVVDGGRTICLSSDAEGIGTYCFDTVECEWRQAGDWMLPFEGGAEYVPDHKLWVGFSPDSPYCLCETSDLSTMAKVQAPKLQHVWQDLATPESWAPIGMNLVNLGSGRFCIARVFQVGRFLGDMVDWEVDFEVAVLTGLEMVKGGHEGFQSFEAPVNTLQVHGCSLGAVNHFGWPVD